MNHIKYFRSLDIIFLCLLLPLTICSLPSQQDYIALDVSAVKTRDLLKILAQHAGKNIIVSEQITSTTNFSAQRVHWREALNAILQLHNLTKHETTQVITIMPQEEFAKNETSFLHSAVFNLHHITATQAEKVLSSSGILSPQGKIGVEPGTNVLVAVDTADHLIKIKKILQQLDTPAPQILIEARIVSADSLFLQKLGLEIYGTENLAKYGKKTTSSPPTHVNTQHGTLNFRLANLGDGTLLDLQLAALENSGRGKVIAHPKLLTTDRHEATIEAGAEIPYQEKTKEGNTSTMFKKAVLSLKVTPEVITADTINLNLQLNQDKISHLLVQGTPAIDTRKIQTQVVVRNNETIVLGGIYEWSKVKHTSNIPILGHIPFVGLLFSKKETRLEKKELLIFVTPRIVCGK